MVVRLWCGDCGGCVTFRMHCGGCVTFRMHCGVNSIYCLHLGIVNVGRAIRGICLPQPAASSQATDQLLQVERSSRIHPSIPQPYMIDEAHVQHNSIVKGPSLCSETTLVVCGSSSSRGSQNTKFALSFCGSQMHPQPSGYARSRSSIQQSHAHNSPMHTALLKGSGSGSRGWGSCGRGSRERGSNITPDNNVNPRQRNGTGQQPRMALSKP
nr:hypothetical protein [Tanacetum cinerariifolium]